DERCADPRENLDDFRGLQRPDKARQDAQHAAVCAGRYKARRWRLLVHTPVARSIFHPEDRHLPLELKDRGVDVGDAEQNAGIVDEIPRREIVGPVSHHVVVLQDIERILTRERCFMSHHLHEWIDILDRVAGGVELLAPNIRRAVNDLAVQIRHVDYVEIDDADFPDAGRSEIEGERRAEATGTYEQHGGGFELLLSGEPERREREVAAVSLILVGIQLDVRRGGGHASGTAGRLHHLEPAGDRRDDGELVAIAQRRLISFAVADVVIVDVDVDELTQLAAFIVQMLLQLRIALHEPAQCLADGRSLDVHRSLVVRVDPQRRRYVNLGHISRNYG